MRLRVLYTIGQRTQDLFWLSHNGTDVYCGPTKLSLKLSYHESGKVHTQLAGEKNHDKWHEPLADLKGGWCMMSTAFKNSDALEGRMNWPTYTGAIGDCLMMVDGRSIPRNVSVQIDVGLTEAGNLAGVPQLSFAHDRKARLLQVYVDTTPWAYAVAIW